MTVAAVYKMCFTVNYKTFNSLVLPHNVVLSVLNILNTVSSLK